MTDKVLASSADVSPDALLKQAILGARASAEQSAKPVLSESGPTKPVDAAPRFSHIDPRLACISAAALVLGAVIGAGAMGLSTSSGAGQSEAITQVRHQVEAIRAESERQVERLAKSLAQLQDGADAARSEAKARNAALTERLGKTEQSLGAKIVATGDRLEQSEKDQTTRLAALTTQIEKRAVVAAIPAPMPAPQAAKSPAPEKATAPEPTETGSLTDKPKSAPSENWAVREVYDGIAVLEDRKRRLIEVGPGDIVPGVGRIDTIERRGKAWTVVTKHGTITPQAW